jgi:pimeloyl-ACP methyl ester carboxylesterase
MNRILGCVLLFFALFLSPVQADDGLYATSAPYTVISSNEFSLTFTPKNRPLDLRVTWPRGGKKLPVLIWSHGAFGSRESYQPLVSWWASHGYVVIQPTHADSLQKQTVPFLAPRPVKAWDTRPQEVSFIIDHLKDIADGVPEADAVMDRDRIAVGGHSYGAHTTMLIAGLTVKLPSGARRDFTDPRPLAFIMISPQGEEDSIGGITDDQSFDHITRPALFVTGSNDKGRKSKSAEGRLEPFHLSPPQDKYLLYIEGAHHNFGGISGHIIPGMGPKDDKNDSNARAWLTNGILTRLTDGKARITTRTP